MAGPLSITDNQLPQLREFGDATAIRSRIYGNVLDSASRIEPVSNARHTLRLTAPTYDGPEEYSLEDQKKAILSGQTLTRKLRGTWELLDNATGQVLDAKKTTVANVPYITPRGTFIYRGSEYTLAHQLRLRPGVFARERENGELEAHVNILPGKGLSHRIFLEPETGVFKLRMGQANVPLLPLLKALGTPEKALAEAWGPELLAANKQKDDTVSIGKLYRRLLRDKPAGEGGQAAALAELIRSWPLDKDVTRRTLGAEHANLSPEAYLDITKKLLAIRRKEAEPDDRDHLAFQQVYGPEDLLAERLLKVKAPLRKLLFKASLRNSVKNVPPGMLDAAMHSALLGSGLGQPTESINPLQIFEQQVRVSRMGEGGIPSLSSIPEEARNVQPSHFGYIDGLVTPESLRAGVDLRFARGARKGEDGRVYTQLRNIRTGQLEHKAPQDIAESVIAFPGELASKRPLVQAMVRGQLRSVPRHKVDFELPHMEDAFSIGSNLVPFKSASKGQRAMMAERMLTQALPVVDAEAPLVQAGMPGTTDRSYEEEYGKVLGALHADKGGQVVGVAPGKLSVRYDDGTTKDIELYNHFALNRKTGIHQTPVVEVGQRFQPGELLVRSNYTDKHGATALGKNARVAYIPFKGLNFEDAIVISESFAKRSASDHYYQHVLENSDDHVIGRKEYISLFPSKFKRAQLDNFDDSGLIKPGTEVTFGDPLVLAARKRERSHNSLHRGRSPSFADAAEVWNHHSPGIVTDVHRGPEGVNVIVKSMATTKVGDKMSGRWGDKGVLAAIVPDAEMPRDAQDRPFEILMNPLGLISRANSSQVVEAVLGKIAEKTGKPYKVRDFEDVGDLMEFAQRELDKHGLSDEEDIFDPGTNRKIKGVLTGNRFIMKLHHTAESKGQGRGIADYTAEGTPARGGEEGSKRLALMDVNALLSSGATEVIRDAALVRGQQNPLYWQQYMSGHTPPVPEVPAVYKKFVDQFKAAGINVVRDGTRLNIMAMTGKDVDTLAEGRDLENAETVHWRDNLKPATGGLFDPALTGGHGGNRWSAIKLHEPMLNPVMEEPARRLLNLTEDKFRSILAGRESLNGFRGPKAIHQALSNVDLDREIAAARVVLREGKRTARDAASRKLGYLKAAKRLNIHPRDWMLERVPVLPPKFRPVSVMQSSKRPMVADPNFLYKDLFDSNANLKSLADDVDDLGDERLAVYDAMKAVTGLGEPIQQRTRDRRVKGLLSQIFGSSPKYGTVQQKLIGSAVDIVGRAVITPNPDLDMDQVGLPENAAWNVYRPFVVRRLVRNGMGKLDAVRAVVEKQPAAREALLKELGARPVIIDRAPVLHRYGVMAFWPQLTKGDTLQVPPLIVKGFGADFDGDQMNYHVPVTDEAVEDAVQKLLPSRNLLSTQTFKVHQLPANEYVGGLYSASTKRDNKKRARTFADAAAAMAAYRRGEIDADQPVEIVG